MNLLTEMEIPYIFDSLTQPFQYSHFWTFDGKQKDFMFKSMTHIESNHGPTVHLLCGDTDIKVPGGWFIMVIDPESSVIDMVPVTACATQETQAVLFCPSLTKRLFVPLSILDITEETTFYPSYDKSTAIIHALAPFKIHGKDLNCGVVVSPNDLNRYLNGCVIGDIL